MCANLSHFGFSSRSVRRLNGNPYVKTRIARHGLYGDQALDFLDDAVSDVEAETGSFTDSLGGEKWLEDFRLDFLGNSRAVVGNFDQHIVVVAHRANTKFATVFHDVGGVVDQIGPHLVQLA